MGITKKTFLLWSDVQTLNIIIVENVPVEIRGGPRFLLTALVFLPGQMPSHIHDFSLDNGTLRRLEVEQAFHPDHSTLYFPTSDDLIQANQRVKAKQYVLQGYLILSSGQCREITMLVDSGVPNLYISRVCLQELGLRTPPKHINISLFDGLSLHSDGTIETADSNVYDVTLGREFLGKNQCLFDYGRKYLTLRGEGAYYTVSLTEKPLLVEDISCYD